MRLLARLCAPAVTPRRGGRRRGCGSRAGVLRTLLLLLMALLLLAALLMSALAAVAVGGSDAGVQGLVAKELLWSRSALFRSSLAHPGSGGQEAPP